MRAREILTLLVCIAAAIINIRADLPPVIVSGKAFLANGTRFIIRGLAYQPTVNGQFVDYIHDDNEANWSRDIPFFKQLGINVVRVYETDPERSHEKFMKATARLGIYILFDIPNGRQHSINRKNPEYSLRYLEYVQKKIEHFSGYDNTFAFLIGNEVANDGGMVTAADTFIKASLRDAKNFAKTQGRSIPIGYAAADVTSIRDAQAKFWACGDTKADFYAINIYSWCGGSATFETSGYADRMKEFRDYPLPVFFSEYGCNVIRPREFNEVRTIYSADMLSIFSGGVMYEYSEEVNQYGLVRIKGSQVQKLPDYDNFAQSMNSLIIEHAVNVVVFDANQVVDCPQIDENWKAKNDLPVTPSRERCECAISKSNCIYKDIDSMGDENDSEKTAKLLNVACGLLKSVDVTGCQEIAAGNATTGTYGTYGGCELSQKLSIVYDKYFQATGGKLDSCDFNGNAKLVTARVEGTACSGVVQSTAAHNRPADIPFCLAVILISYFA